MNERRQVFETDDQLIEMAALAMRRNGDAILDGTHRNKDVPKEWGYTLLGMAGWLEAERHSLSTRTRPFAVSISKSFFFGGGAVDL